MTANPQRLQGITGSQVGVKAPIVPVVLGIFVGEGDILLRFESALSLSRDFELSSVMTSTRTRLDNFPQKKGAVSAFKNRPKIPELAMDKCGNSDARRSYFQFIELLDTQKGVNGADGSRISGDQL
jgi:hypothetical protein